MGINDYFYDVIKSFETKKIFGKLDNLMEFRDDILLCYKSMTIAKSKTYFDQNLILELYSEVKFVNNEKYDTEQLLIKILIDHNSISLIEQNSNELFEITNKEDLFNLSLNYNINLSYETLKYLQELYIEYKQNIIIFYGINEEKMYGY